IHQGGIVSTYTTYDPTYFPGNINGLAHGGGQFQDTTHRVLALDQLGYSSGKGAGGTVTQQTSKSTAVTLNNSCGTITMHDQALAGGTLVGFTMVNSNIEVNDVVVACIKDSTTHGAYVVNVVRVPAGGARFNVTNITGGSLSEAVQINFAVIKGSPD